MSMTTEILRKVSEITGRGSRAIVTTPLRPQVQDEIDAGHLTARVVRSGPLGLASGEMFLSLTDAGQAKLQASPYRETSQT